MRNKRILSFLVALVSLLTLLPAASAANDVYVGQTFYFGNYEQDGNLRNGDEPILWRVYSVDYGSRTVRAVSEYGLDSMVYNRSTSTTSWHNSTIRSWLNSTFLSSAFTSAEQGQLNSVYVSNSSDYVYILSQWEIQQYLDTELLYATEYARQSARTPPATQAPPPTGRAWTARRPSACSSARMAASTTTATR